MKPGTVAADRRCSGSGMQGLLDVSGFLGTVSKPFFAKMNQLSYRALFRVGGPMPSPFPWAIHGAHGLLCLPGGLALGTLESSQVWAHCLVQGRACTCEWPMSEYALFELRVAPGYAFLESLNERT